MKSVHHFATQQQRSHVPNAKAEHQQVEDFLRQQEIQSTMILGLQHLQRQLAEDGQPQLTTNHRFKKLTYPSIPSYNRKVKN
jgi:hypothetical protein